MPIHHIINMLSYPGLGGVAGLEDEAKQYKRDIFLKCPELEALIEYIDIQFDAKE